MEVKAPPIPCARAPSSLMANAEPKAASIRNAPATIITNSLFTNFSPPGDTAQQGHSGCNKSRISLTRPRTGIRLRVRERDGKTIWDVCVPILLQRRGRAACRGDVHAALEHEIVSRPGYRVNGRRLSGA